LTARKGQDRLIDILPKLHRRLGAKLLLVGEGRLANSLRRRTRRRKVEKAVVFAGKVPDELLPAYYAAADVFAMPVRNRWFGIEEEGFGVVFVEAAAAGLPMVVGNSGGTSEAVQDGATGYLVDGSSVAEVQQALSRLLGNEALRKKMGVAARERAMVLHGARAAGEKYRKVLQKAAEQKVAA
jgi:phosphatidylinositol alpha-1,6-mannosyltransferase